MFRQITLFISIVILLSLSAKSSTLPARVIEYNTKCKVSPNKLTVEHEILVEIINSEGSDYAEISIPYSKKARVDIIGGWIEDCNGVIIRELKRSEIKDKSDISNGSLYEDDFVKTFELKNNHFPYRIRYNWKYTYDNFIEIVNWNPFIGREIPTINANLEVLVPSNFPLKIFSENIDSSAIDTLKDSYRYRFVAKNIILPSPEYNSDTKSASTKVRVIPLNFSWFTTGSHSNWKEFGNWIDRLNQGSDDFTQVEREKIKDLVKNTSDTRQRVDILYRYLQQHTRYINVSIGAGSLKPYPCSYVLRNNYGDCKALTIYMQSMLNAVKIPSYYAVVYAGEDDPGVISDFPTLQFNHAILIVPLKNDTIFLDCTAHSNPTGYMGTFTQGRKALVIKKDSSFFITVPKLSELQVKNVTQHTYQISADLPCKVDISNYLTGYNYDKFSYLNSNLNHKQADDFLRETFFHFSSFELENWKIENIHPDTAAIKVTSQLQLNNFLKTYGNDLGFQIYPLSFPMYEKPEERNLPLKFEYPQNTEEIFIYNLQHPLKASLEPLEKKIESKFGRFSITINSTESQITIKRCFLLFSGLYSLKEYKEFYSFIQQIKKINNLTLMLTKI